MGLYQKGLCLYKHVFRSDITIYIRDNYMSLPTDSDDRGALPGRTPPANRADNIINSIFSSSLVYIFGGA